MAHKQFFREPMQNETFCIGPLLFLCFSLKGAALALPLLHSFL